MNLKGACPLILKCVLLIFLAFYSAFALAQSKSTVSGYVTSASSGEQLIGVNIYESHSGLGTSANEYGFYSLTIPDGPCNLRFTFVGHTTQNISFQFQKDTVLNVELLLDAYEFQEVQVTADKPKVDQSQMSVIDVPINKMTKIPVIMGEPDVLKVIQLLPGVQSGTEGTSGIYVRGGGADQNLFLLDGVPVYNASHMFGFFSVFNPGAVKTVKLYKGGFPARYGGRLSSVVDIRMKEGNDQEFKGDVSIGLISSRINLEGPLVKGKSSFLFSARRTYVDILAKPIINYVNKTNPNESVAGGYYFYDLNGKLNYKFSDRSRLYLSAYMGKDKVYMNDEYKYVQTDYDYENNDVLYTNYASRTDMNMNWGNRIAAIRWNYVLSNKLFSNTTLTYSKYNFNTHMDWGEYNLSDHEETSSVYDYYSSIQDYTGKIDFDYSPHPNHAVKFGSGFTSHYFKPGVQTTKITTTDDDGNYNTSTPDNSIRANEYYAYIEDNLSIGERFKVNAGLHYSGIIVQGKHYASLQPRASARYKLMDNWSVKASYAKMNQFVHLLSSSSIDMPTDLWVPVTARLKPPISHQYAIGTSAHLNFGIDITVEGFYKSMNNLIAYSDGASFSSTASTSWDNKVELGEGWAYGAEFLLEKSVGKTTGWIGYTWSKSERQFEELNNGEVFPAHYDRRHDFSFVLTHAFSDRFDVGVTWVYNTGKAVTLGAYQYPILPMSNINEYSYVQAKSYGGRNSYRMPSYHRMDVGMNFHKKKKRGIRTWNVSLYNAYSNSNPFMLMSYENYKKSIEVPVLDVNGNVMYYNTVYKKELEQLSLFPIIPSVSYTFKF